MDSIKKFKILVSNNLYYTDILDEESKRFYLISLLVTEKRHKEAEVFKEFSTNDEYIFVCPNCEEETFLWNEENTVNAYSQEPVIHKNQKKLEIDLNTSNTSLEWLEKPIEIMNINSLKPLVPYFRGDINCHNCGRKSHVFNGIMNSI